jgi:hypothetical protein
MTNPFSEPTKIAVVVIRAGATLRVTPGMEAGIADHVWSIEEIVRLLENS